MIPSSDLSQEIFAVDFLKALKALFGTWSETSSAILTAICGQLFGGVLDSLPGQTCTM